GSLPGPLAAQVVSHEAFSVRQKGWNGLRNGVLHRAAVEAGFDVLITADKSLPHQQNLAAIGIATIIVTRVRNRLRDLRPLIPEIQRALAVIRRGDVIEISPKRADSVRDHVFGLAAT